MSLSILPLAGHSDIRQGQLGDLEVCYSTGQPPFWLPQLLLIVLRFSWFLSRIHLRKFQVHPSRLGLAPTTPFSSVFPIPKVFRDSINSATISLSRLFLNVWISSSKPFLAVPSHSTVVRSTIHWINYHLFVQLTLQVWTSSSNSVFSCVSQSWSR